MNGDDELKNSKRRTQVNQDLRLPQRMQMQIDLNNVNDIGVFST